MFTFENEIGDLTVGTKPKCTVEKGGINIIEQEGYQCTNCSMLVCKSCKADCHKGHTLTSKGLLFFACACYWKSKDCKKLTTCSFAYTKRSYYGQLAWTCSTCNMVSGNCLCSHCSTVCHKGHTVNPHWSSSCFCDCYDMFSFCSLKKSGWKE